jgi:hypothetical protein
MWWVGAKTRRNDKTMKSKYTHISMILDRSGSMSDVKMETISGFNAFLEDQRKVEGTSTLTLVQFDSVEPYDVIHDFKPLDAVVPLDGVVFQPRGMTPLRDSVMRCITETGLRLAALAEDQRPERVIFVIITDGLDNRSRHTPKELADQIQHQTDMYNWKFVYLGANQDAIAQAKCIGIAANASMSYARTSAGVLHCFASVSRGMKSYRTADLAVASSDVTFYTEEDRKAQEEMIKSSKQGAV